MNILPPSPPPPDTSCAARDVRLTAFPAKPACPHLEGQHPSVQYDE
jgi:hypothetical protein